MTRLPTACTDRRRHARLLACAVRAGVVAALLFAGLLGSVAARAQPAPLELVVLGSGGPRADGRAASGNLVLLDGVPRLMVDAGSGIFARVGELKSDLAQLDTILLTHLHIDHTADVPSMLKARAMVSRDAIAFRIFGPGAFGPYPATTRFIGLLFDAGGAWGYQRTFGAPEEIAVTDLTVDLADAPHEILRATDLAITAVPTRHGDAPSVAYRLTFKGRSLVFSGDIDPTGLPNLTRLAADADMLVFNCAVLDPPGSPADLYSRHTPPARIGQLAAEAKVRKLVLTHIAPLVEKRLPDVVRSVAAAYAGPIVVAEDKLRVPLP